MEPLPGAFVGGLELLERVGAGGFAVVWKARRPETGELFALKLPRVDRFLEHLRREASLSSRLCDPQVVPVLEARLSDDPPHLVMPWIEGAPLALPGAAPEPRASLRALATFVDVTRVVARLHEAGVVHGDLKPGNILWTADGSRILDLGLARVQMATRLERSLAQSLVSVDGRSIAGTLDFMAPELFDGAAPSAASDVYSLGVILHHLMTGRPPAFGVSPEALNPDLPPGLEDLLRRMLHHDPARRIARAGDVVPEIGDMLEKEARCLRRRNGHARRRVLRSRMATLKRGAKPLALGALLVVLSGAVVAATSTLASRTERPEDHPALLLLLLVEGTILLVPWLCFLPAVLMAITTINAFILGVPEKAYKNRSGHPLWSFMMQ